jgi:hypothetical protein
MERLGIMWWVMGLVKRGRIEVIDGVEYEIKGRARYCDDFRFCSRCQVWIRRVDLGPVEKCPNCRTYLRGRGLGGGIKRYINLDIDIDG